MAESAPSVNSQDSGIDVNASNESTLQNPKQNAPDHESGDHGRTSSCNSSADVKKENGEDSLLPLAKSKDVVEQEQKCGETKLQTSPEFTVAASSKYDKLKTWAEVKRDVTNRLQQPHSDEEHLAIPNELQVKRDTY